MKEPEELNETTPGSNKRKLEDDIQLAKQKAQEIAARLVTNADTKRPRFDDSSESPAVFTSSISTPPFPVSFATAPTQYHGAQGASKKVSVPNGKVGVIIGKGGETIKSIQLQSGAKIQITKDTEADPYSLTREVELMGTSVQISRAEQLINDVIAETDAGGSASSVAHGINSMQPGAEQFVMKVPNNKVALLIGKGGETIKYMQSSSGTRIQVIPLHLPPGDTSTERTVYINGLKDQIDSAKELINEVVSGKRLLNAPGPNSSMQQPIYPPSSQWVQPGQPPLQQQPQYGYTQPGNYPTPPAYYGNYSTQTAGWDQSNPSTVTQAPQQTTGYNFYGHQTQTGSVAHNPSYNYDQTPTGTGNSYDQNSQQALNYGLNISNQPPPFNQQRSYDENSQQAFNYGQNIPHQAPTHQQIPYHMSGYGPPAGLSQPDSTVSSQLTQQSPAYPHAYSQPTANPQAVYWTSPNFAGQPTAQTGFSETAYGGPQSATLLPSSSQPIYGQVGYPPQATAAQSTAINVQGTNHPAYGLPPAQPQPPTNGFTQSLDYKAEKIGDENSHPSNDSTAVVQESVHSQS